MRLAQHFIISIIMQTYTYTLRHTKSHTYLRFKVDLCYTFKRVLPAAFFTRKLIVYLKENNK